MKTVKITARVKRAIRKWADVDEDFPIRLDDKLASIHPGTLDKLRLKLNSEFRGEICFPIGINDWLPVQSSLKTVKNVRDLVRKRLEGKC